MLVRAAYQTKREFCIALLNRRLHENSICPGNHDVDYRHGWFYYDGSPSRCPELTAEADEIMASGSHYVGYSSAFNTYLLIANPSEDEDFADLEYRVSQSQMLLG